MTSPGDPELREPDLPRTAKVRKQALRTGWTTGTCAAAAAKAAATALYTGEIQRTVEIGLPSGQRVRFPVDGCATSQAEAEAVVVKDAGDDPDVTHGARLTATVRWRDQPGLELDGGVGVGVVTKPGLGLEVGGPAINPVPRAMITQSVGEAIDLAQRGIQVIISVPDGEKMARKTTNARLGIIGGISILGTTGIVRPFSTASWRASVEQAISVLAAQGEDTVVLCTGGRTEKGAMKLLPQLPEVCFVEVGDFTGAALRRAVEHQLNRIIFVGMAGKLTKLAAGVLMTHYTQIQGVPEPARRHHPGGRRRPGPGPAGRPREHRPARGRTLGRGRPAARGGPRTVRPRRPRPQPVQRRTSRQHTKDPTGDRCHHGRLHRPDQDRRGGGMSPEVTVIGCDGGPFSPQASKALATARLVIGAPRHLEADPNTPDSAIPPGAERKEIKHLDEALDTLDACSGPVVVLASGDPGFFGIVRALRARGIRPNVIPATSSVTLAFARLGLDWDDALVVSAHGRDPRQALAAALAHPKAAILTAPRTATARDLGAELLAAGKKVYVAERLGTPQERITDLAAEPAEPAEPAEDFAEPNILIAIDPEAPESQKTPSTPRWLAGHQGAPDGWALPEDAFEHRDSMITKAEVRALILARLGPAPAASSGTWARARVRWRWSAPGSAPT